MSALAPAFSLLCQARTLMEGRPTAIAAAKARLLRDMAVREAAFIGVTETRLFELFFE